MADPIVIPLTAWQRRDVAALLAEARSIQDKLNIIARTVVAGAGTDPETLGGATVNLDHPEVGIVITPAPTAPQLMKEG